MNNKLQFFNLAALLSLSALTPAYAALEGALDSADCNSIKGWAWDNANPATRVKLDIYDVTATKTTRLTTVTAQKLRDDLLAAGKGDGRYGFVFTLPAKMRSGETHQFSVRFQGTDTDLAQSPQTTAMACYGKLNDTGIQSCGDGTGFAYDCPVTEYPGQDGDYGRDADASAGKLAKKGGGNAGFDFTKIANDGSKLPTTAQVGTGAKDWACTQDNVTGLLWEIKTDDSGLRDKDNTFSWYNPDSASNGGDPGAQSGGAYPGVCSGSISCDTQSYISAVNALKLCGKSDWRLPNVSELQGILDFSRDTSPTIDNAYFSDAGRYDWWSSATTFTGDYHNMWAVSAYYGGSNNALKIYGYRVRLVRGEQ